MRSATDFLPLSMMVFMNLVNRRRTSSGCSVYFGSGSTSRLATSPLRGICFPRTTCLNRRKSHGLKFLLGPLSAVLRAPLPAVRDPGRVQGAADDVVAHARQV